jgi:hypothetical protein
MIEMLKIMVDAEFQGFIFTEPKAETHSRPVVPAA